MPSMSKRTLQLIIADDHALVREGLKLLVSAIDGLEVVGEAAHGGQLTDLLARCRADVLMLDLGMPGFRGLPDVRALRGTYPHMKILILTANAEPRTVDAAMEAGADGYLVKSGDLAELPEALDALQRGETYLSVALRPTAAPHAVNNRSTDTDFAFVSPIPLTRRERELLALIARGSTARDVAARLGISPLTVRKHRENLMRKLDLHSAGELAAFAVRLGLPIG
jgi:DNA-binding NarL/FixJ family response regulator